MKGVFNYEPGDPRPLKRDHRRRTGNFIRTTGDRSDTIYRKERACH